MFWIIIYLYIMGGVATAAFILMADDKYLSDKMKYDALSNTIIVLFWPLMSLIMVILFVLLGRKNKVF